ncbi:MAG: hypothetical protein KGM98_14140 [Bacteroidota bacterium]|nr:hypothetical protein [Bacteroidota bacterium]
MKVISFLSRLAVICNIAFVAFVILSRMEAAKPAVQVSGVVSAVSYVNDLIITLGISAIFLNLAMVLIYLVMAATKRFRLVPKWMAVVNSCFLFTQVVYFFFR